MADYIAPGEYTERIDTEGTPLLLAGGANVLLIGKSKGKDNVVKAEKITRGVTDEDVLSNTDVKEIFLVSDTETGAGGVYRPGVDFDVDSTKTKIEWKDTTIDPPTLLKLEEVEGGTIPAGDYYIVVTHIRRLTEDTWGETTKSNELSITLTEPASIRVTWQCKAAAEGTRVYLSTTSGNYTDKLAIEVSGGANFTALLTEETVGEGTPPTENGTKRRPYTGQEYYASYIYKTFEYLTRKRYTDLGLLLDDHQEDSELGIAGKIVMGRSGTGQSNAVCWTIALEEHNETNYLLALEEASKIDELLLVVPLVCNFGIQLMVAQHCFEQSDMMHKRERFCFFGAPIGTAPGDESTEDTFLYYTKAFRELGDECYRINLVAPDGTYINVRDEDGNITTQTLDGCYAAAGLAARIASMPDLSDPATSDKLFGFEGLYEGTYNIHDNIIKDILASHGVTVLEVVSGIINIRHAITVSLESVEKQEISIMLMDDEIARDVRKALKEKKVTGKKKTAGRKGIIKRIVEKVFENKMEQQRITSFNEVTVKDDPTDPRKVIVSALYEPMYPLNVVLFQRGFTVFSA